jgi:hypothetical protein
VIRSLSDLQGQEASFLGALEHREDAPSLVWLQNAFCEPKVALTRKIFLRRSPHASHKRAGLFGRFLQYTYPLPSENVLSDVKQDAFGPCPAEYPSLGVRSFRGGDCERGLRRS